MGGVEMFLKITLMIAMILGISTVRTVNASEADFDGKNKTNKNVITILHEETPNLVTMPVKAGENNSQLVRKLEILNEKGEFVEVQPVKSWIDENGIRNTDYTVYPNTQAKWGLKCENTGDFTMTEAYSFSHDKYGGHFHYSPAPPPLKATNITTNSSWPPNTDFKEKSSPIDFPTMVGNVQYYYWEWYPEFATRVVEWKEAYGACYGTWIDNIDVKIPGLVSMDPGSFEKGYWLRLNKPWHPKSHYVVPEFKTKLENMGLAWRQVCPNSAALGYNQMSLPWGGLFDINQDWKPPHKAHRFGIEADIAKRFVRKGNRKRVIDLMCGMKFDVYSEGDLVEEGFPHYHIVFSGSKHKVDFDEKWIKCCGSPTPQGCIDLGQNHQETEPVEPDCF